MKPKQRKKQTDWEERTYTLAVSLFFHDIRRCDMTMPESRLERWPSHIRVAAEMAVEAARAFVSEYRKSAKPENMEEPCNAP